MCLSLNTWIFFTLPGSLLHLFFIPKASPSGHFEDNSDEVSPHIEWVPIVQRNLTEMIQEALHDDYQTETENHHENIQRQKERLIRIGKMLDASYRNMEKDAKAGNEKIRILEQQRQNAMRSETASAESSAAFRLPNSNSLLLTTVLCSLSVLSCC